MTNQCEHSASKPETLGRPRNKPAGALICTCCYGHGSHGMGSWGFNHCGNCRGYGYVGVEYPKLSDELNAALDAAGYNPDGSSQEAEDED